MSGRAPESYSCVITLCALFDRAEMVMAVDYRMDGQPRLLPLPRPISSPLRGLTENHDILIVRINSHPMAIYDRLKIQTINLTHLQQYRMCV